MASHPKMVLYSTDNNIKAGAESNNIIVTPAFEGEADTYDAVIAYKVPLPRERRSRDFHIPDLPTLRNFSQGFLVLMMQEGLIE